MINKTTLKIIMWLSIIGLTAIAVVCKWLEIAKVIDINIDIDINTIYFGILGILTSVFLFQFQMIDQKKEKEANSFFEVL
jgi:hypothetical protein